MHQSWDGFGRCLHIDIQCIAFPTQRIGWNGDLVWTGQNIIEAVFPACAFKFIRLSFSPLNIIENYWITIQCSRRELPTSEAIRVQGIQCDCYFLAVTTGIWQAFEFTDNGGPQLREYDARHWRSRHFDILLEWEESIREKQKRRIISRVRKTRAITYETHCMPWALSSALVNTSTENRPVGK